MRMLYDVWDFARALGVVKVGVKTSQEHVDLYEKLVKEEYQEFIDAPTDVNKLQEAMDLIWVLLGYCICRGWGVIGAWRAVRDANMAKIQLDPATGELHRRSDGKILKPDGWQKPNLAPFLNGEIQHKDNE